MNKRKLLYFISFMMLTSSLLYIVGNNVPILASYRWVWAPIFIIFVFSFYIKDLGKKIVFSALLYGVLYVGIFQYTIWINANDWYRKMIFEDFYAMIVFVMLFSIYHSNNYIKEWIKLAKISFIYLIIAGIMTIIVTGIDPMVIRNSYSSAYLKMSNYKSLYSLGFGSYGYMSAIVTVFPILVYFYKLKDKSWLSKKVLLVLIIFFYFVLVRAQIFANILVASLIILLSFSGSKNLKRNLITIFFIIISIIIIPKSFYINTLSEASSYFNRESELYYKLNDMSQYLRNPELSKNADNTGTSYRLSRYPALYYVFSDSPVLGDAVYDSNYDFDMTTGGHLYWMSRLALWGILGILGYFIILKNVFGSVLIIFDSEFKFYYYLSLASIIALGLIKNLSGREPYIMLLFIIPGLYIMKKEKEFEVISLK